MRCVEAIGRDAFSLDDVYAYEAQLSALYPGNANVRPKIRQQLQVLRDQGYVESSDGAATASQRRRDAAKAIRSVPLALEPPTRRRDGESPRLRWGLKPVQMEFGRGRVGVQAARGGAWTLPRAPPHAALARFSLALSQFTTVHQAFR